MPPIQTVETRPDSPAAAPAAGPDSHTPGHRSGRGKQDQRGFTMNELLVVLIIIGVLGLIGTGVYFLFIRDARSTVLNQNIQTAAEEMQSVLAIRPSLAGNASLATEMTSRTNFVWVDGAAAAGWLSAEADDVNTIRYQFITNGAHLASAAGAPPAVTWIADNGAVRLHLRNSEDEWRCALIVLRPDVAALAVLHGAVNSRTPANVNAADRTAATEDAAEMRGVWYDGGDTQTGAPGTDAGVHDCSPVANMPAALVAVGTVTAATAYSTDTGCVAGVGLGDECVPVSAQRWMIPDATANVDNSSSPADTVRTFHRSPSGIDID